MSLWRKTSQCSRHASPWARRRTHPVPKGNQGYPQLPSKVDGSHLILHPIEGCMREPPCAPSHPGLISHSAGDWTPWKVDQGQHKFSKVDEDFSHGGTQRDRPTPSNWEPSRSHKSAPKGTVVHTWGTGDSQRIIRALSNVPLKTVGAPHAPSKWSQYGP